MTPALTSGRAIRYGTPVVGNLGLLDARVFFGLRGIAPLAIEPLARPASFVLQSNRYGCKGPWR